MKNFTKNKKLTILVILLVVFIISGFKCGGPPSGLSLGTPRPITLQYWKVWEDKSNMQPLISAYTAMHPHIKIEYRNLTFAEFEKELLNALAVDRGPDIFSIHTSWLNDYTNKITPLPSQITIPYVVHQGTIKKETYTEKRTKNTLSLRDLRELFPDVVYENQLINNKIYGLPLSIDSLALYYNKDLLNNAGIISPPKTWAEFQEQVIKLTKQTARGEIVQAGAAFGTADNVERSQDLLALLMMQNGTVMTDSRNNISIDRIPAGLSIHPAAQALNFYTSYASPAKQVYTWNNNMDNSLQAFMAGKTGFFFGYAYQLPTIKTQAPSLRFEIAPMPQTSTDSANKINYANYWIETVSQKSEHIDEAWDFIVFITTNAANNKKYLTSSQKPTALKSFIKEQSEDLDLGAFVSQLLTVKSWYQGKNALQSEEIFKQMIRDNLKGLLPAEEIIKLSTKQLKLIY
jgi:multiple sugar transport system substrate-binding protein